MHNIIILHARAKGVERRGGPYPKASDRGEGSARVDSDRAHDGGGVQYCGAEWEAVQGAVWSCPLRYHNHLDGNINTAEWSAS